MKQNVREKLFLSKNFKHNPLTKIDLSVDCLDVTCSFTLIWPQFNLHFQIGTYLFNSCTAVEYDEIEIQNKHTGKITSQSNAIVKHCQCGQTVFCNYWLDDSCIWLMHMIHIIWIMHLWLFYDHTSIWKPKVLFKYPFLSLSY